ncbi:MAG: threonine--tRNA ligase, partial [Treponemataceae bacterium]|nr:threonine--tRNA ligase [Treponemataceae bacterium]
MAIDEKINTMRHSCAHIMAEAVLHLYPKAKIAIGPAIENGFYYDFDFGDEKISDSDLVAIEKEMRKILSTPHEFKRREVSKEEALEIFKDQPYKIELINDLPENETISTYE